MNDIAAKVYLITKKHIYSCEIYLFWKNNEATLFNLCRIIVILQYCNMWFVVIVLPSEIRPQVKFKQVNLPRNLHSQIVCQKLLLTK